MLGGGGARGDGNDCQIWIGARQGERCLPGVSNPGMNNLALRTSNSRRGFLSTENTILARSRFGVRNPLSPPRARSAGPRSLAVSAHEQREMH